ncbi:MAG TPA: class I SAM-dependent methyltransferase [Stellaceae bacterium]|nr:class I SAM-dependent methyltransferase [Stellaceae bacterium]
MISDKTEKDKWLAEHYVPFEQGCRERFFLAAANFLFSNYSDSLAKGYYFEFGSHKGRTMQYAWRHTRHNFAFTYVGFDSFEGLPELDAIDRMADWQKGSFAMSEDNFVAAVVAAGIPRDRLVTVRGFYDKTLTPALAARFLPRKASIIYIDCDLYKSTVPVLNFIPSLLQPGTLIALDDWNCYLADPGRGQRRAWAEFCAVRPEFHFEPFYSTHMMTSFVFTGFVDQHA